MSQSIYCKSFDEVMKDITTDYLNLDEPPSDVTKGSMPFIMASVMASQSWGLRQFMDFITRQIVPGPGMATEFLNRWAGFYDIVRTAEDTDLTLLDKILTRVRMPPAGGNKQDYANWALDQTNSFIIDAIASPEVTYFNKFVTVVDVPFGPGSVGVFTIPNDETIIFPIPFSSSGANDSTASFKLIDSTANFIGDGVEIGFQVTNTDNNTIAFVTAIDSLTNLSIDIDIFPSTPTNYAIQSFEERLRQATFEYIETKRPLGINPTTVVSAKPSVLNIIIDVKPTPSYDNATTIQLITAYRDTLAPGQSFFSSIAACIAVANGAASAIVTTPATEETTIGNGLFHRGGSVIANII